MLQYYYAATENLLPHYLRVSASKHLPNQSLINTIFFLRPTHKNATYFLANNSYDSFTRNIISKNRYGSKCTYKRCTNRPLLFAFTVFKFQFGSLYCSLSIWEAEVFIIYSCMFLLKKYYVFYILFW